MVLKAIAQHVHWELSMTGEIFADWNLKLKTLPDFRHWRQRMELVAHFIIVCPEKKKSKAL